MSLGQINGWKMSAEQNRETHIIGETMKNMDVMLIRQTILNLGWVNNGGGVVGP